jgi:predicted nucleotidyltransferase component of viral defense system
LIPRDHILEWRELAPWPLDNQVEQDLVIRRALVAIFSPRQLRPAFALRGGTALYKLHFPAARYSEGIDLVQTRPEPAGPAMAELRAVLDPWLGEPRWKQTAGRVTFTYRFVSEAAPPVPLRLKVEATTREHFSVEPLQEVPFSVRSRWFSGECRIVTYTLDELLATKLRALYQRKQGRDLFDLATVLQSKRVNPRQVASIFLKYLEHEGHRVTRTQFEENLALKMRDAAFLADIGPLLADGYKWEPEVEAPMVSHGLISLLPGEPWRGTALSRTK